jgi:predicted metal-dependent peptidase
VGEVDGILRKAGIKELNVVTGDTEIHTTKKLRSVKELKMAGGGGTDMGGLVEKMSKSKPSPEIIIVITDGYTPWCDKVKQKTIVVVSEDSPETPDWMKRIEIKQ